MDMEGMTCHGCGSTNVTFDAKRRVLLCFQCGKEEYYSRSTLNANGKVLFSKQNAMKFFAEGKLDGAQHYALDVLNVSKDNAPALYIMAYYDAFTKKKDRALSAFFHTIDNIALEYDEVRDLIQLFKASAYNLMDYEFDMILLLAKNMQAEEDAKELGDLLDFLCPLFIGKRSSSNFLTPERIEIYRELAEHCEIPKTCFALIKAIQINPDSPCAANAFHLQARTKYFYEHFVLPVGDIVSAMKETELKPKFLAAYQKIRQQYEENMNQQGG